MLGVSACVGSLESAAVLMYCSLEYHYPRDIQALILHENTWHKA